MIQRLIVEGQYKDSLIKAIDLYLTSFIAHKPIAYSSYDRLSDNSPARLSWYYHKPELPKIEIKDFWYPKGKGAEYISDFIFEWLGTVKYGPQPPCDGSNSKDWTLTIEEGRDVLMDIVPTWIEYHK